MAAEDNKNLVEISENTIDIAKYMKFSTSCKTVLELRYEDYVPMAIHCIKYVCSSARVSWNLYSIAVAHRLGTVPVRETNIFIAVSSVHRADALEARRFIIDEVKAPIPIWKKAFLERRSDLSNKDVDCSAKMAKSMEHSNKKPCCGTKVKVDDEVSQK
ncbi:hypothetical protein AAHE18_18G212100 [Arachis hypogaea]